MCIERLGVFRVKQVWFDLHPGPGIFVNGPSGITAWNDRGVLP